MESPWSLAYPGRLKDLGFNDNQRQQQQTPETEKMNSAVRRKGRQPKADIFTAGLLSKGMDTLHRLCLSINLSRKNGHRFAKVQLIPDPVELTVKISPCTGTVCHRTRSKNGELAVRAASSAVLNILDELIGPMYWSLNSHEAKAGAAPLAAQSSQTQRSDIQGQDVLGAQKSEILFNYLVKYH